MTRHKLDAAPTPSPASSFVVDDAIAALNQGGRVYCWFSKLSHARDFLQRVEKRVPGCLAYLWQVLPESYAQPRPIVRGDAKIEPEAVIKVELCPPLKPLPHGGVPG
jgi:hypothetical protein